MDVDLVLFWFLALEVEVVLLITILNHPPRLLSLSVDHLSR